MWNRELAEIEFLRRIAGLPKNLRRDPRVRQEVQRVYNHEYVRYSMTQYAACTLDDLQPYIGEVFGMMYGSRTAANAESVFLLPNARVVTVSPSLVGTMFIVSAAVDAIQETALADYISRIAAHDKKVLTSEQSVDFLREQASITAQRVVVPAEAKPLVRALRDLRTDPGVTIPYYERFKGTRPEFVPNRVDGAFAGIHFILGHEIAHHLLSHGHNVSGGNRAHGKAVLNNWLEIKGVKIPRSPRPHFREYSADALAILLGAHSMGTFGESGLLTCRGAFIATMALSLVEDDDPTDLTQRSRTHPTFRDRCVVQLELLGNQFAPLDVPRPRGLGRDASGHPIGYSLQVMFLCLVVAELTKLLPGSAFVKGAIGSGSLRAN